MHTSYLIDHLDALREPDRRHLAELILSEGFDTFLEHNFNQCFRKAKSYESVKRNIELITFELAQETSEDARDAAQNFFHHFRPLIRFFDNKTRKGFVDQDLDDLSVKTPGLHEMRMLLRKTHQNRERFGDEDRAHERNMGKIIDTLITLRVDCAMLEKIRKVNTKNLEDDLKSGTLIESTLKQCLIRAMEKFGAGGMVDASDVENKPGQREPFTELDRETLEMDVRHVNDFEPCQRLRQMVGRAIKTLEFMKAENDTRDPFWQLENNKVKALIDDIFKEAKNYLHLAHLSRHAICPCESFGVLNRWSMPQQ